jgi:hypothetical protein
MHGPQLARGNVRERFELYGIKNGRLPVPDSSRFKQICISEYQSLYQVPRRGPSRSAAMKKATMGMNFSAMELSVLIHALKQQLRPIIRLNQSGMRTNDHELDEEISSGASDNLDIPSLKRFIVISRNSRGN